MNIPINAKRLDESESFLVLKTGNHRYCVFSKNEDKIVYESTSASDCYSWLENEDINLYEIKYSVPEVLNPLAGCDGEDRCFRQWYL